MLNYYLFVNLSILAHLSQYINPHQIGHIIQTIMNTPIEQKNNTGNSRRNPEQLF